MVKTWNTANAGSETCDKCGAVYSVTVTRFPMRDKDSFNCNVCGNLMDQWNSTESKSYSLIERPEEKSPAG
jgi:hypothetical protein